MRMLFGLHAFKRLFEINDIWHHTYSTSTRYGNTFRSEEESTDIQQNGKGFALLKRVNFNLNM